MLTFILLCILAFFIGAIPFGYLVPKITKGMDIRKSGSGNPGATNVYRTLGPAYGIPVFILDFLKGFLPAMFLTRFLEVSYSRISLFPQAQSPENWYLETALLFGILAVLGHIFTPFLGFRGGKGIATAAGIFCYLVPIPFFISLSVFIAVLAAKRIVSLASVASAAVLPWTILIFQKNKVYFILSLVLSVLLIYRHKNNIAGIIKGTEKKIAGSTGNDKIL